MFGKILIANRGAIACRIMRTCRRLGVRAVAIYSNMEGSPLHAEMADLAIGLPDRSDPVAAYLDIGAVIDAAKSTGAEAIHPGYGFLSENPEFASACTEAGLTFIGPTEDVIRLAGNKREARIRMQELGVPVLVGTSVPLEAEEAVAAHAASIGFPLMVKASEGGGGIGMQIVEDPSRLERAVRRTKSSARRAFGSQDVYLEQFIPDARHVEVQILADADGRCVHLWERECSVQRRHQKVVEEAGSPSISDKTRDGLITAAGHAADQMKYVNAGTFEFIVDPNDDFYFLEINARLQVEHGTTEMVTGVDIVEQQLRISAGEGVTVHAGPMHGHAIQCRIYAEDPVTSIPSPGRLNEFEVPRASGVRVDTGFRAGDDVTSYFDPLLAKVIVWGETREDALELMIRTLDETRISGVKTNIPLLRRVLRHRDFARGRYNTALLHE